MPSIRASGRQGTRCRQRGLCSRFHPVHWASRERFVLSPFRPGGKLGRHGIFLLFRPVRHGGQKYSDLTTLRYPPQATGSGIEHKLVFPGIRYLSKHKSSHRAGQGSHARPLLCLLLGNAKGLRSGRLYPWKRKGKTKHRSGEQNSSFFHLAPLSNTG